MISLEPADVRELRLRVDGMACDSCAQSIEQALDGATGVEDATVDFATSSAVVRFDTRRTDAATLERVVDGLGFEATVTP
ncbi:MAG: heavy-metal-associated domain-containing protein [Deltaproteobacteria bacterium]|nr:heavy-metal-associated domain-containing protein [Deltaproteobacteria bacterium]